LSFQYIALPTS